MTGLQDPEGEQPCRTDAIGIAVSARIFFYLVLILLLALQASK